MALISFSEWLKKFKEAGFPYDPKVNVKTSAGGWWGAPKSMVKPSKSKK